MIHKLWLLSLQRFTLWFCKLKGPCMISGFLSCTVCNCNYLAGNPVHDAGMNALGRKENGVWAWSVDTCEPKLLTQCRVWKEKLGFMHFADGGLKDFFVFLFLSSSAFFLWIPVWNFQPLMSIINHHLECPKHTSIRIIILHLTRLTTSLQSRQMSIQAQTTHSTHRMLQISIQNQVLELNPKPSTLQHYPSFTTR